jgi:pimeloyl-ACP methyl ester carboxylesterase
MTDADPQLPTPERLERPDGGYIAYRRHVGKAKGLPGVVFIHGLRSDMDGGKAERLHAFCAGRDQSFVRFDCRGHGLSSGVFEETVLSDWADDAALVVDKLTEGPQIVVGSSMGGWLMLLTGLARPGRVSGLVGIAAAPDFTSRFRAKLTNEDKAALERDGQVGRPTPYDPHPYVFTKALLDDGDAQSVLNGAFEFEGRIRLLHGMLDDSVPWELSLKIANQATTPDVRVHLIKDGDHRLSRESDLRQLCQAVAELSEPDPDDC